MRLPAKATHAQTRQHNHRLVLRTLYDFGPISRAEVARSTGLTRTTVGDVVGDLLDEGMVEEVGRGPSTGGKSPILLSIVGDARLVIGLDLGESTFSGALVNLRGEVRRVVELPVEGRNGDDALDLVFRLVDELLKESSTTPLGIGVGTPGLVDTRTGTIRWAVNLDWQDLPLGGLLHERYGLPSNVANDSQAAALAEYTFGGESHGQRLPNLVTIKVGRGIGAGLVLNGSLFQGDGFGAGEIGHVAVVDDGAACRCGRFGCLETVASSRAIAERAAELARELDTPLAARAADGELEIDDLVRGVSRRRPGRPHGGPRGRQGARPRDRRPDRRPQRRPHRPRRAGHRLRRRVAGHRRRRGPPALADAAQRRHGDRLRPADGERRGPRRIGAPDHPRARPEPRPVTDEAGVLTRIRPTASDRAADGLLVGVDVGGSKIAVILVDRDLRIRGRHTVPTSVGEPDEAAPQIASAVEAALASAGESLAAVKAVGVGVPGRVDPATGVVSLAVNLGWHNLPLRDRLEAILGVPCAIENDVRAAAAGILERRVLGDIENFIYLSVGTGISAGVVIDGVLHRGTRGLAGEIGHVVVDADGPVCPCGLTGCLETIASGPAIARAAGNGGRSAARGLCRGGRAATRRRLAVVDRAGASLARAIHALVMTYDVERIVLGGGVSRAGDAFLDPILRELDAMRAASELAADMLPAGVVAVSPDGGDVGTWGGISIARAAIGADEGRARPEEVVAREANA